MAANSRPNLSGICPLFILLATFVSFAAMAGEFYRLPALTSFFFAAMLSLFMRNTPSFERRLETFVAAAGRRDIVLMIILFLLVGVFSYLAQQSGTVEAVVRAGMGLVANRFLTPAIFVLASVVSFAMGSSVGVVVAVSPIALEIARSTGIAPVLVVGAVVSGAMFGDNLSLISDTSIAATAALHTTARSKMLSNARLALPSAALTAALFYLATPEPEGIRSVALDVPASEMIKIVPYLMIVLLAASGVNAIATLCSANLVLFVLTLSQLGWGLESVVRGLETVSRGLESMLPLSVLAMLSAGVVGLVDLYGGLAWIFDQIQRRVHSQRGARLAVAALATLVDGCTANNTVSIVMIGDLARELAQRYQLDRDEVASQIDIYTTCTQGLLPYGAQLLIAAQLAQLSPFALVPYVFYVYILAALTLTFSLRRQATPARSHPN